MLDVGGSSSLSQFLYWEDCTGFYKKADQESHRMEPTVRVSLPFLVKPPWNNLTASPLGDSKSPRRQWRLSYLREWTLKQPITEHPHSCLQCLHDMTELNCEQYEWTCRSTRQAVIQPSGRLQETYLANQFKSVPWLQSCREGFGMGYLVSWPRPLNLRWANYVQTTVHMSFNCKDPGPATCWHQGALESSRILFLPQRPQSPGDSCTFGNLLETKFAEQRLL